MRISLHWLFNLIFLTNHCHDFLWDENDQHILSINQTSSNCGIDFWLRSLVTEDDDPLLSILLASSSHIWFPISLDPMTQFLQASGQFVASIIVALFVISFLFFLMTIALLTNFVMKYLNELHNLFRTAIIKTPKICGKQLPQLE